MTGRERAELKLTAALGNVTRGVPKIPGHGGHVHHHVARVTDVIVIAGRPPVVRRSQRFNLRTCLLVCF